MRPTSIGAAVVLLSILGAGCKGADPAASLTPEQFLKWSMNQYAAMSSFRADCAWRIHYTGRGFEGQDLSQSRSVAYMSPNMFDVTSKSHGIELQAISDGSRVVFDTNNKRDKPTALSAPDSLSSASNNQADQYQVLRDPLLAGSLVYSFFGGSPFYDEVVDSGKEAPAFGPEENVNGEPAMNVTFYGSGLYGHVDMLIGEKTGLVYRVSYDSEARIQEAAQRMQALHKKGYLPQSCQVVEMFEKIQKDPELTSAAFVYTPPRGVQVSDMDAVDSRHSPIPLGSPAPDFTLTSVDGASKESLSSLKGKVVMIDFWATWCGPCKASLPHTDDLYKKYESKGLAVMTISDETSDRISEYLGKQHLTFPTFRDPSHIATNLYGVNLLPTVAIIDKQGRLADYFVGFRSEDQVLASLKKAGLG